MKNAAFSAWLMKSEPSVYSLEDLRRDGITSWEGVRNFQARNYLRDSVGTGDLVLFYHSNAQPSGVAGIARVKRSGYPDQTARDKRSGYYDARSTSEKPLWYCVDLEYVETFRHFVSLDELKKCPALKGMEVIRPGTRLSVHPVRPEHFETVRRLGRGA